MSTLLYYLAAGALYLFVCSIAAFLRACQDWRKGGSRAWLGIHFRHIARYHAYGFASGIVTARLLIHYWQM